MLFIRLVLLALRSSVAYRLCVAPPDPPSDPDPDPAPEPGRDPVPDTVIRPS